MEFEASETYFFDLEGKITGVNQFTRAIPNQGDDSEE
jgi:hypothetical protein